MRGNLPTHFSTYTTLLACFENIIMNRKKSVENSVQKRLRAENQRKKNKILLVSQY